MKKAGNIITLSALLATSSLFGGGDIAPAEAMVVPVGVISPNPFYLGLGLVWAGLSEDVVCLTPLGDVRSAKRLEDSTWGGIVRAGYDFNQYVGIEARALKASTNGDFSETTHYGIYLKPMMPIGEQMNVYGLLGYGKTKITTDFGGLQDEFTHSGFSYGAGLEYDFSDRETDREQGTYDRPFDGHGDQEKGWGLFVDYQNLMHDEGPKNFRSNIVSFGVTYDF